MPVPRGGVLPTAPYGFLADRRDALRAKERSMEPIVDYICLQLKELTAIPSPSGFTKQATAYVLSLIHI